MNLFFSDVKQVFLGTIRVGTSLLGGRALTPARYNLMYAVAQHRGGVEQGELRATLGLARQTVDKMIRRLEELGLVLRSPHPYKANRNWISLTNAGALRLGEAMESLVQRDLLLTETVRLVNPKPKDVSFGRRTLYRVHEWLMILRARLGDTATLWFSYDDEFIDVHDLEVAMLALARAAPSVQAPSP